MSAEENPREESGSTSNPYEQKQAARRARLERAAVRADERAKQHFSTALNILAPIPPGQPILVGHHSERRHRKALERHDTQMRKAIEAQKAAENLQRRAEGVDHGGISSDDPEAIEKLSAKLDELRTARERMKILNALFRKQGTLHDTDFMNPEEKEAVIANMKYSYGKPRPFPAYAIQNIGGRIRATLERIDQLNHQKKMPDVAPETIGDATIVADREENRVLILFENHLSKEEWKMVRSRGFVWSRTRKAFVRKLNANSLYDARYVAHQLAEKQGSA